MFDLSMVQPSPAKKVLVVDDQAVLRRLISLTLHRRFDVREASDCAEAMTGITQDQPDAVILDVMMPGEMDGFELCRRIKHSPELNGIHVVLVTARGQESDIAHGKSAGADAYFVKPFSPLALISHLEHALGAE